MKRFAPVVSMLSFAGVVFACGGGSSLPETEPCPTPTATPTARGGGSGGQTFLYRRTVQDGDRVLTGLLDRFRADYPEDTFYRRDAFRPDFAGWAAASKCVTANMRALNAPGNNEPLKTFDATLETILTDYDVAVDRGSDAVRTRNTSDYKSFFRRLDGVVSRLKEHMGAMP
ncbi:MAG: hypothetical protein ACKVVT_07820 [Dehalococcoidia bacterium]